MSVDAARLLSSPEFLSGVALGAFLALFVFALLGRAPVRFFIPILKLLAWPFRMLLRLLWRTGLLKRRAAKVGAEGATELWRRPDQTDSDFALMQVDGVPHVDPTSQYDFRHERQMLKKTGPLLKAYDEISSDYLPDHLTSATFTSAIADRYYEEATRFFSGAVNIEADKKSLFDDAEGAFTISLFRSVDRRFYFLLHEVRKTLNGNARNLALYLSLFMFLYVAGTAYFFLGLPLQFLLCTYIPFDIGLVSCNLHYEIIPPLPGDDFLRNPLILYSGCSIILMIAMTGLQWLYTVQQDRNTRTLHTFLSRYFSRIADRYREATGYAKQVTVGDETDSQKVSANASRWHKIMMWIPFRAFFMECFIRNFRYQVLRNTGYYHYIPWLSLLILVLPVVNIFYGSNLLEHPAPTALFVIVTVLVTAVFIYLVGIQVIVAKLDHLDWQGFDHLNVSTTMDEVVGKYAEEVSYWKGRLGRS